MSKQDKTSPDHPAWLSVSEFWDKWAPRLPSEETRKEFYTDLGKVIDNYYGNPPDECLL